jgi:hypothetical protein
MADHTETPSWKLKANWMLKELIHIWYGYSEPGSLFNEHNFVNTFMDIIEQYLQDCGVSAPKAELQICIIKRKLTFSARHGSEPTFTSQAMEAEWIAEAVAIDHLQFELMTDDTLKTIFRLAHAIEDIIKTCGTIPFDYLEPIEELLGRPVPNIDELPVIPIKKI